MVNAFSLLLINAKTNQGPPGPTPRFGDQECSGRSCMNVHLSRAALILASALLALCCLSARPVLAQAVAPPPAKVEQLLGLLDDPEVKTWLAGQKAAKAKPEGDEAAVAGEISTVESYVRARITAMVQAVPRLPSEFQRAVNILVTDVNSGRRGAVTAILLVLVAVGYAA